MTESALYPQIIQALSRGATRLFRQNAGFAWQGQVIEQSPHRLVLAHPRAIRLGAPGMADLGGITSVIITPDMVGRRVGVDLQIEVKLKGKPTAEQHAYITTMRALGGRAGIAHSIDEATAIVLGEI